MGEDQERVSYDNGIPTEDQQAAYNFVQTIARRADSDVGGKPLWHGWALRKAYLVGLAAGRQEHVLADRAIADAVAAEREVCARICDAVQEAADERHAANADPGEGSDGAYKAAAVIRARGQR